MAGSAAKTDRQSCPWELVVMRYFQTVVTARLGVAAAATFLALAAPASASTIDIEVDPSFDDDAAVYRAAPGEANQLTIGADPAGAFTFQDPGAAAVTPQAPCMSGGQPATFATCPNGTFVGIVANLGDGDDTASSGASVLSIPLILNGEDGRDRLLGSGAADL